MTTLQHHDIKRHPTVTVNINDLTFDEAYLTSYDNPNNMTTKSCECGCGQSITEKNRNGPLHYSRGHHRKGKTFPNEDRDQQGIKNNNWKGGRVIHMPDGYILIRSEGHPRASKCGHYVPEHVLVMEKHLGRYLQEGEIVHHINGIKDDNRLRNLKLLTKSAHSSLHRKQEILSGKLVVNGPRSIRYNWKN